MKKFLLTLMLVVTAQWVFGQSAQAVFDDYKNEKKARFISVPRAQMSIAAQMIKENNMKALLQEVKSLKVLTLDDCRKGIRKGFAKKIINLSKYGYEEFTRVKDDKDNMLVLVKRGVRYIEEVVLLVSDGDDCTGIFVTGDINPEDIEAIIDISGNY